MPELTKPWLRPFDWEFVTEINRNLCAKKKAFHGPTSDGQIPARELWEKNQKKTMTLGDALQICRKCHRLAPFCFYNGNTFAAIARDWIVELSAHYTADKIHILRSIAGHIVAGTATDIEEKQFDELLADLDP